MYPVSTVYTSTPPTIVIAIRIIVAISGLTPADLRLYGIFNNQASWLPAIFNIPEPVIDLLGSESAKSNREKDAYDGRGEQKEEKRQHHEFLLGLSHEPNKRPFAGP